MWDDQLAKIHLNFSILNGVRLLDSLEKNNYRLQELLNTSNKFDSVNVTRKNTAWAKVFGSIRQHASILHTVLKKGWNCSCQSPHRGGLRLQTRTTGGWSSQFNMTFVVPAEALDNVCREVTVSAKENEPEEKISNPPFSRSFSGQAPYLDGLSNADSDLRPFPHINKMQRTEPQPHLRLSLVKRTGFRHKDSHKAGEQARSSTSVPGTTEIECLPHDIQSRYELP